MNSLSLQYFVGSIQFSLYSEFCCAVKELYFVPFDVDNQFGDKCEGQVSCSFHEGTVGKLNSFSPLVLEGGEWLTSHPNHFPHGVRELNTFFNRAQGTSELVWVIRRREKLLPLSGIKYQFVQPISLSPYPLCYFGSYSVCRTLELESPVLFPKMYSHNHICAVSCSCFSRNTFD